MRLAPIGPEATVILAVTIPVLMTAGVLLWRVAAGDRRVRAWMPWISMLNLTFGGVATVLACVGVNTGSLDGAVAGLVWIGLGIAVLVLWMFGWATLFDDFGDERRASA
jgi:hypothetical protein